MPKIDPGYLLRKFQGDVEGVLASSTPETQMPKNIQVIISTGSRRVYTQQHF